MEEVVFLGQFRSRYIAFSGLLNQKENPQFYARSPAYRFFLLQLMVCSIE